MAADLGDVIRIDPNSSSMTTFRVGIRDCNQGQAIQTIVLLDWNGDPGSIFDATLKRDQDVPRSAEDPELAEYEFPLVHTGNLNDNSCQKLQLLLSGEFRFEPINEPAAEGDLGTATWWLMVDSDVTSPVPLSECQ